MKASETSLLELVRKASQFTIPIYQRTYSWGHRECKQLWDDIVRSGSDTSVAGHFVGSIVYIQKGLGTTTLPSPLLVIDGQQRLTTVALLVEVLARALEQVSPGYEPVDGFSAAKLRAYYLLNTLESGDRRYKLVLSRTDKTSLTALVDGGTLPRDRSRRVCENFEMLRDLVKERNGDLVPVWMGLAKLMVVDLALDRGQDNPQLIFESMNSTGRELSQADLVRNYVLMNLEPEHQTRLYQSHWWPIEEAFGQAAYSTHFDGFMRHYLTLKTGEIPNIRAVYEAFKAHAQEDESAKKDVDALVTEIHTYAEHYCAMALDQEKDKDLKAAFADLRELTVDVAYPFLLELYHDYTEGALLKADLLRAVRLVEAYVFRRAVCNIPTNSLNKTFAAFAKAVDKSKYLASVEAHFVGQPSYRRFPSDDEFSQELKQRDLYNFRSRSYWLRRMENYGRKELVAVNEYTIEHIMPQNESLRTEWREALGPEWQQVQETWLHTLGNLTLTGYNSEYSDRPFKEKRDMKGGFKQSPLALNEGLGALESWNEETIRARAERLAKLACEVWPAPPAPAEGTFAKPAARRGQRGSYTIEDHRQLAEGRPMRGLFESLREELLALDPCVTEEFLKNYVAYKAETNFVDVQPRVRQLSLTLNLRFHEVNDPRGQCRDVSGVGHWGNGEVEVALRSANELPYALGLIRQAFERQMDGDDES